MEREWYYKRNGRKLGPFTAAQFKALADQGKLQRDDVVWKEGMSEWFTAERLTGLFSGSSEPLTQKDIVSAVTQHAAERSPPVSPMPTGATVMESSSIRVVDNPVGRKPASNRNATSTGKPSAANSGLDLAILAIALDFFADLTRGLLRVRDISGSIRLGLNIGHVFLMLAVMLGLLGATVVAVKLEDSALLVTHLGMGIVVLLGQWVARNFSMVALDTIQSNRSVVKSYRLLETLGTLCSVFAVGVMAYVVSRIIDYAVTGQGDTLVVLLLMLMSVLGFLSILMVSTVFYSADSLNIRIDETATAGQEFLGFCSFCMKVVLYMGPFVYALCSIVGSLYGGMIVYVAMNLDADEFSVLLAEGTPASSFSRILNSLEMLLIVGGLVPLAFYVWFLVSYLAIDLCYSVLAIRKLNSSADAINSE